MIFSFAYSASNKCLSIKQPITRLSVRTKELSVKTVSNSTKEVN